jgi:hypothetical protein
MVFQQIMEALNPGYPGDTMPERMPNFDAAIGR